MSVKRRSNKSDMTIDAKDFNVLRKLAGRVAETAALPVQEEKRELWRRLNGLNPVRPMVMIDQVCWNEMNVDDELTLQCNDAECRGFEEWFRRKIFQWEHFPVDMVIEAFFPVAKAVKNTRFDVQVIEETAETDPDNNVRGHKYANQFQTEKDLEKIYPPEVRHDETETARRVEKAESIFGDILEIRETGVNPYISLWDPLAMWMGVENALYALVDRPDYMHCLLGRMTDGYLEILDQLEEKGLLCRPQSTIHCTGAYTDELPGEGYNPDRPRARDIWVFGLAQMFSSISPDMFREFEVDYTARICERFGLVYYGCCDPLDGKMNEVRMIPNVRKVSMSPWVDEARGAAETGGGFVYSRKPNPALLAMTRFDGDAVRNEFAATLKVCGEQGCPVEFILKDLSTVSYEPQRLFDWAQIAMEMVCDQG